MKYLNLLMMVAAAAVYAQDTDLATSGTDLPTAAATALPTALPTELPTIPESTTECDKDALDTCLNGVASPDDCSDNTCRCATVMDQLNCFLFCISDPRLVASQHDARNYCQTYA